MSKRGGGNPYKGDHYTQKAKAQGFEARSVFKLEEIDSRFHIFRAGDKVLDIGAAPGSWSRYALRRTAPDGKVLAVDLKPIELSAPHLTTMEGDAFSPEIADKIARKGPYTVILSDAAPNTSGNRNVDTLRSTQLVEQVIDAARSHLAEGGNLVTKIFQGGGEQDIIKAMRSLFGRVKPYKPGASRKGSFETFLIGLGRR